MSMKIALMTDMEGVAGVLNFKDWVFVDGRYYEIGKELLTREVNAAIDGFFAAGADEIVVIDGHGPGGINPVLLDERAWYSRGWGVHHEFGLSANFDAIAWVGQHAKAGTRFSHLAHTGSPIVLENKINGISMGEFGECAAIAGFYGASAIFGAGEKAFVEEAKALIPSIHTVWVKYGVGSDDGAECDAQEYESHNLGAVHLHPNRARELIREGAYAALNDFIGHPDRFPPLRLKAPYIIETWYRKNGSQPARKSVRTHPTDLVAAYSVSAEFNGMES